jgi:hypothetical protein
MKILFIFICIFILNIILFFTCYKTTIYSFKKNNKSPTILFISGTHGNEDTGPYCLSNLVNQLKLNNIILKKGRVFIVPNFNKCGLLSNSRHYNKIGKKYDLNRLYGKNFIVNRPIENLVKKSDIIIDLHDAWGYYKKFKGSIGSTIYYHNFKEENKKQLLNLLNKNINEDFKKFSIISSKSIKHNNSLKKFIIEKYPKKKYILFETTGQNNIQDIHLRAAQCDILIKYILESNNMI